jgi:hypothetical protein
MERRSTRRNSVVADPSTVDVPTGDSIWRLIFAKFLANASSALVPDIASPNSHPYFYLLRSNGRNSLCLLTGLSVETYYYALLIGCKLVDIKNNKDGSKTIHVFKQKWLDFLYLYRLRGGGAGGWEDHAEFTSGRINIGAIDGVTTNNKRESAKLAMLRVGKVRSHDDAPQCTAINHREEPPRMTAGMRTAKLTLNEDIRRNNLMCYTDVSKMVDVYAVVDWVLMEERGVATPDATTTYAKRKRDDDNDDDNDDEEDDEEDNDEMMRHITPRQTVQSPLGQPTPSILCAADPLSHQTSLYQIHTNHRFQTPYKCPRTPSE